VGSDGELTAVGGPQGEVYLLGPDGKLLWQASAEGEIITPPLVGHGYVIVRTIDGRIVAFDAETGEEKWIYRSRMVPLNLRTTRDMIFLGQNAVLAGFSGGTMAALDLKTGNAFWQTTVSYPAGVTEVERVNDVAGAPTWVDSRVCAVTFQGRIGCFNAQDGQPIWTHPFSSYGGLVQDPTMVASVNEESVVSAYDANTGAKLWSNDTLKNRRLTAPLIVGNALVVGDYQGYVHFIARDTGALVGRTHTDNSGITSSPVLLGHLLIVQTRDGRLYAYRPR
jgi:outer membrane protein assembly factor BamB